MDGVRSGDNSNEDKPKNDLSHRNINNIDLPHDHHNTDSKTDSKGIKKTGAFEKITGSPEEITGSQEEITESPKEITESPAEITESLEEVTESPKEITESSSEITQSSKQATNSPSDITEKITKEITEETTEETTEPPLSHQSNDKTLDEPESLVENEPSSEPPTPDNQTEDPPIEPEFGSKPKPPSPHRVKLWIIRILLILLALIFIRWTMSWYQRQTAKTAIKPVPVVLDKVQKKDMPIYIPALGTVTPLETVTVKTQINGILQKVLYTEGQKVNIGDLLAEIDPRPYEAQLEEFQGQIARDEALLANARIDLERYEKLFIQDSVSQQTLETQRWLVKQLEGSVKLDQGLIDQVKVNLLYCRIISPIDGHVGLRLVDAGNFVQTTDTTGLVVINTIQPITVIFAIPEDYLPTIFQQSTEGKGLVVEAYDRAQNKLLATGSVLTFDNRIDTTTGTVKVRAVFQNENKILFPNQFVNVFLKVTTLQNATVIPQTALQYGAQGSFVFVVNKKENQMLVKVKPIVVSAMVKGEAVISGDVFPDQEVVVEGGDNLRDDSLIQAEPSNNNSTGNLMKIQNNVTQNKAVLYHITQNNAAQYNITQNHVVQHNITQNHAAQHNITQNHAAQHKVTQTNVTQNNVIQNNATHHHAIRNHAIQNPAIQKEIDKI